jgi:phage shock protein PspC (stress-responsive transcriptional regulator)
MISLLCFFCIGDSRFDIKLCLCQIFFVIYTVFCSILSIVVTFFVSMFARIHCVNKMKDQKHHHEMFVLQTIPHYTLVLDAM